MRIRKKMIGLLLAVALVATAMMAGCEMNGDDAVSNSDVSRSDLVSESDLFTPHRFSQDDLTVNGMLPLGLSIEEVKAALGQPDSEQVFDAYNEESSAYTEMVYGKLHLSFFDPKNEGTQTLGTVWTDSDKVKFAGGLHVGSTAEEVLNAFTFEEESEPLYFGDRAESVGDYIYSNYNRDFLMEVKPKEQLEYAYVNRWAVDVGLSTEYTMEYYCGGPLVWNEEQTAFSGDLYSLIFYVDSESEKVTTIVLDHEYLEESVEFGGEQYETKD